MPNLVGIGNSQVSTNAMLGGLAYQDSVGEIDIEKIKARTSDTAVDVFVYDTRKDSDGGAWRHRTQDTSWYNEVVSAVRGARKEFPAVAVIVAMSNSGGTEGVTSDFKIYDGDDPNLPMWMDFRFKVGGGQNTSVTALNGKILLGATNNGVLIIDFISDTLRIHNHAHRHTYRQINPSRLGRTASATIALQLSTGGYEIVNENVKDVAIIVLPNAPIDDATGLPTPTIAVATAGGLTLIKDDGNAVQYTDSSGSTTTQVMFTQDGYVAYAHDGSTSIRVDEIKSKHFSWGSNKVAKNNSTEFYVNTGLLASGWSGDFPRLLPGSFSANGQIVAGRDNILLQRNAHGLNLLARDFPATGNDNRVCHISDTFNTGWMVGDCRGAWLSSTDSTDATANNLLSNGTFDSDTSGWSASNATLSVVSGRMRILTSSQGHAYASVTTVIGKQYVFNFDIDTDGNANAWVLISSTTHGQSNPDLGNYNPIGEGNRYGFGFRAITTTTFITLRVSTSGTDKDIYVDDCVCELAERDGVQVGGPSVNQFYVGYGLRVIGTVVKAPVATGSDLMAYGPFTGNDFLQHPINDSGYTSQNKFKNFGTNDFYIMSWVKLSSHTGTKVIYSMWNNSLTSPNDDKRMSFYITQTEGEVRLYQQNGGSTSNANSGIQLQLDQWNHVVAVRKNNNRVDFYVNGVYSSASANTMDMDQDMCVNIGVDRGHSNSPNASVNTQLALMKVGKSNLTNEQVLKIFNDEVALFQPNSKAVLYGSSSDITGIAHDSSTDVTHVGTSSGRSEFQGLKRINNTTTAVTCLLYTSDAADE